MTASLGTGAIMLSRAMRPHAPKYSVVSRIFIARVEIASVIILDGFQLLFYGSDQLTRPM
jgi:hypothetical protein